MKRTLKVAARLLALTIVYFICFAVASATLLPRMEPELSDPGRETMVLALLVVSFLNTAVLAYVIHRSRWSGWQLALTVFVLLFGVVTVLPQIETAAFVSLPNGMLPRLFLAGAVFAALFAALAILILGKGRGQAMASGMDWHFGLTAGEWIWKLVLIAAVYVAIYFSFGYFIAWKNPAVRAYYGGRDPVSFVAHMRNVWRDSPWLPALQVLRAGLWTALAVLVMRMMKGRWVEAGFVVALLFAVLMNSQLLLPNPLMPQAVRLTHLLETATSNFLFGWIVVWVLYPGRPFESHGSTSDSDSG